MNQDWKKTAAAEVRRLSPEQAKAILARIRATGATIHQSDIRDLTGGYNSQAINFHVARLLGKRAGYIRG